VSDCETSAPRRAHEPFGERLRRLRHGAGLTQRQLAGDDLHPSYVSLLEAGRRTPTADALAVLAARLGVSTRDLNGDGAPGLEAPLALAEAALGLGRPAEAVELLDPFAAAWSSGTLVADPLVADPLVVRAAFDHATALERVGRPDDAVRVLETLRALDERAPGRVDAARVAVSLVRVYRDGGDLDLAIDLGERALARLGPVTSPSVVAHVELVSTLAGAYSERGDLLRSASILDDLIARTDGDPEAQAKACWNAAITATERGRAADGLLLADRATALLSTAPDPRGQARLRITLAWVLLAQSPPDATRARAVLREALPLLRQYDSGLSVASAEAELARCELVLGRPDVARRHAASALRRLAPEHRIERARSLAVLGSALLAAGDREAGTMALDESAQSLEGAQAPRQAAVVWRSLADAHRAAGDLARAFDAAQRALDAAGVVTEPVTPRAGSAARPRPRGARVSASGTNG